MKIVCVDDEILILQLTVSMCERLPQDPEVAGFDNVKEALSYFENNIADIAILDINMPDMDGFSMAAHIRKIRPNISILFTTGYADYSDEVIHMHASDCLLKPLSIERLTGAVNRILSCQNNN